MYKLNYQEHNILKQAAYKNMQEHNKSVKYNKALTHTVNQELAILYKTNTKTQLLDIIDKYLEAQQKQDNKKLILTNQRNIILPQLKTITESQLEHITLELQELEKIHYLQLDTDYNSKQSIIESYQQVVYYKHYNIPIPKRKIEETLMGNLEILDKAKEEITTEPDTLQEIIQKSQDFAMSIAIERKD